MGNDGSDESNETEWVMAGAQVPRSLYDRIDEHKENGDYSSKSENIRALFRKGLKHDESPGGIPVEALIVWAGSLLIFSTIEWQLGFNSDWIGVLGFGLLVIGAAYSYVKD